jgi:DNA-directed RNA polymerase specialized sigma subunit
MIRTDAEYRATKKKIEENRSFAETQRQSLEGMGLTPEQVEQGMQPLLSFHAQFEEEIEWYERVRRRDIEPLQNLSNSGRLLIALRIANGMTQKELAERLGVSEGQVSRDEHNEYHNITVDRFQKILNALNESVIITVVDTRNESSPMKNNRRDIVHS